MGYSSQCCKELDKTEETQHACPEREIKRDIDFKELAHVVVEAWQIENLQVRPPGWRPREVLQLKFRGTGRIFFCLKEVGLGSVKPFSFQDECPPLPLWKIICFTQNPLIELLISSRKRPSQKHLNNGLMFGQISGHWDPAKSLCKIYHHTQQSIYVK